MRRISFLDDNYPVRTVYTGWRDTLTLPDWRVPEARSAHLTAFLGTPLSDTVFAEETHSSHVRAVTAPHRASEAAYDGAAGLKPGGCDALVTEVRGVLLCIWTADCLPLTLYDPMHHAAAMVHCGWRGIRGGIPQNTLIAMAERYGTDPGEVVAAIGPCICADCYEVGGELREQFSPGYSKEEIHQIFRGRGDGKYLLDLRRAVTMQLEQAGVIPDRVHDIGICTFEDRDYPSFRRERKTEKGKQILSGIVLL